MAEKPPELEIGGQLAAELVDGPLHGQCVNVRLGLNGPPRTITFPRIEHIRVEVGFPEFELRWGELRVKRPPIDFVEYKLYETWPLKYRHVGDDDDPPEVEPWVPKVPEESPA